MNWLLKEVIRLDFKGFPHSISSNGWLGYLFFKSNLLIGSSGSLYFLIILSSPEQ